MENTRKYICTGQVLRGTGAVQRSRTAPVPLNTLVNRSAMQNGCKPFFGIYMIIDRIVNRCYTVTITKAKRGNHYVL